MPSDESWFAFPHTEFVRCPTTRRRCKPAVSAEFVSHAGPMDTRTRPSDASGHVSLSGAVPPSGRSSPYGLSSSRPSSPVACAPLTAKTQPTTDVGKILLRMPGAISRSNVRPVPSRLPRSRSDDKFETGHPDPGGYHRRGSIGPRCPRTVLGRGLVGQTERRLR